MDFRPGGPQRVFNSPGTRFWEIEIQELGFSLPESWGAFSTSLPLSSPSPERVRISIGAFRSQPTASVWDLFAGFKLPCSSATRRRHRVIGTRRLRGGGLAHSPPGAPSLTPSPNGALPAPFADPSPAKPATLGSPPTDPPPVSPDLQSWLHRSLLGWPTSAPRLPGYFEVWEIKLIIN